MPEGFQPLDVDYREDESTDLCTESDSEEEGMVQRKLELESADSRVDVCEETQASELQDHTQREPKNNELITIIPETQDFDNVENLEDASTSRNNELEMEEYCKSNSSQETYCDEIDGIQNTLSEELFNTGSLVESVIPLNKKHTSVEVSQEKDGMQGELSKENRKPEANKPSTAITSSVDLFSNSIDVDRGVVVEISHSITRNKPNQVDSQNSEAEGQLNFAIPVPENITEDDINQMQQLQDCVAPDLYLNPSPTKNDADIAKLKPPSNKDSLTEQSPAQAAKSVVQWIIPDPCFNQKNLTDSESGESTRIEEYASPLKDDNTEAPVQKDFRCR
ncbi:uncharacterized protein LOC121857434 [Homarus americanus]|uniref:uncharacterized protein LOC121857434 n=1 Tax=Homarus americanus TaxID=6706 RepID=UPI001C46C188|nr:uncharacterized protein LOC121857434 [Homarus americanus]